tara:strand:+ start:29481 stop:32018 length:2538 start_codon:yes stop_codon:yes gene_type:complete
MNRQQGNFLLLFLVFFGVVVTSIAQDKLPAREAFEVLKERYAVTFSFIEKEVEHIQIAIPSAVLSLDEALILLEKHPLLSFKKVSVDRIAVAVNSKDLTICGRIVDAQTKEILIGASVFVIGLKGTIADENGTFNLLGLKSSDQLVISFLGYETQKYTVSEYMSLAEFCPIIGLVPEQYQLNEVVVSNLFTTGLNQRLDGRIDFSTNNYGILPGLVDGDVLQMIQVLPGVQSVNESIADINVRGGSHDQNLILWDAIKMYHSGHFFGLISAFNPEITNQVKVIKNGTSAAYTDGVSGTIIMNSNDVVDAKFNGSVSSNLLSTNAVFRVPLSKKVALHVSGRRAFTDFYNSPTYNQYFERSFQDSQIATQSNQLVNSESDFYFYDFNGKLLYDLSDQHKLRVSMLTVHNQLAYSEVNTGEDNTASRKSTLRQDNFALGATLHSDWNTIFSTDLQGYYTNYDLEAFDFTIATDQSMLQLNEVIETGIKLNTTTKVSKELGWSNGYNYTETGTQNASDIRNPTYQIIKKRVQRNHGLFSELTYADKGLFVRAGARLNYFERLGTFLVEPRLNINQKLTKAFSIKLQGEFKNQTVTQFVDLNEDFLGVENRRWIVSDGVVIPIVKSKQVSLGLDYKNKGWYVELNPYYKEVTGIITESQGFVAQNQYDGFIGSSTSLGLEFLINKSINSSNFWMSYTYGNQQYLFEDISSEKFPSNFDVTHAVHIASSVTILGDWKIALGAQYRTGRPFTQPVEGNETYQDSNFRRVNYGALNKDHLPSYLRVDASTSYNLKLNATQSFSVSFGILNLLNKKNVINRYYEVSAENENEAIQIENFSLGFTPNFSFKYAF